MVSSAGRLRGEALKLAPDERVWVVAEVLATPEPDRPSQQGGEAEWVQEIERPALAANAGGPGVSWTGGRNQVQSRLSTR